MGSFLAALRRSLRQVAAIVFLSFLGAPASRRLLTKKQKRNRLVAGETPALPGGCRPAQAKPDKLPLHAARLLPPARRARPPAPAAGARRREPAAVAALAGGARGVAGGARSGAG